MSEQVQAMFSSIAHRYDRANNILSLGVHHAWRRIAVKLSGAHEGDRVLDCATGTGDLALLFKQAVGKSGQVVGTDLNPEMLSYAPGKALGRGLAVSFLEADVQSLPFAVGTFTISSIAFGIRNVDKPLVALTEMARVVVPGGKVVVLEFGQPHGLLGVGYRFYSKYIMPRVGALITGHRQPYEYLPETAAAFPSGPQFLELMRKTGAYSSVSLRPLTGGVAYVYVGTVR